MSAASRSALRHILNLAKAEVSLGEAVTARAHLIPDATRQLLLSQGPAIQHFSKATTSNTADDAQSRLLTFATIATAAVLATITTDSNGSSRCDSAAAATSDVEGLPFDAEDLTHPDLRREHDSWLMDLPRRKRIFFKYEKRIREFSTAEKVFEYFSSVDNNGVRCMSPGDLLKALVPVYPPDGASEVRTGHLAGERIPAARMHKGRPSIFATCFDTRGGMKCISFTEYLLLVTLLSISDAQMATAFAMLDDDESGAISEAEFAQVVKHLIAASKKLSAQRTGFRTGFKGDATSGSRSAMLENFFGKDGEKTLGYLRFQQFLQDLRVEMINLEFDHYDYNDSGFIDGIDFARCLVAGVDIKHIDHFLDRAEALPEPLKRVQISRRDFAAFHAIRPKLHLLLAAIKFYHQAKGGISAACFERIVRRSVGVVLEPALVNIVYEVFKGSDGMIQVNDLCHALVKKDLTTESQLAFAHMDHETEKHSVFALFECIRDCAGFRQP